MNGMFSRFALFALCVWAASPAHGATLTVTSSADSGAGSLRQAIADAAPGDTIDFAVTGTTTLTSGQLGVAKSLTVAGPGASNLTISGNNSNRVFSIISGTVTIAGLSLFDGPPAKGRAFPAGIGSARENPAFRSARHHQRAWRR